MRNVAVVALALAACAGPRSHVATGEPVLDVVGRVDTGPYVYGKDDLARLTRRAFRALPPGHKSATRFEGVFVSALLRDTVELKKGVDTAVFHGKDGYVVPVPLSTLRQYRPVLADTVDGVPAAAWQDRTGPLVLAWPNLDQPGIDTDPRMRWWWVEGVTRVEMESWVASYGRALQVPPGASDEARLGADVFNVQCQSCHRLRGVGGQRGPDLTRSPVRTDPQAFARKMGEHLRRVGVPQIGPDPATLRQVGAFLREIEIAGDRFLEDAPVPEQLMPAPPRRPGYPPPPDPEPYDATGPRSLLKSH